MKAISTNPLEEERRDTEVCYFKFINPRISITGMIQKQKQKKIRITAPLSQIFGV